jgi:hypothetical protein
MTFAGTPRTVVEQRQFFLIHGGNQLAKVVHQDPAPISLHQAPGGIFSQLASELYTFVQLGDFRVYDVSNLIQSVKLLEVVL